MHFSNTPVKGERDRQKQEDLELTGQPSSGNGELQVNCPKNIRLRITEEDMPTSTSGHHMQTHAHSHASHVHIHIPQTQTYMQ